MKFNIKTITKYINHIYSRLFLLIFNRYPEGVYLNLIKENASFVLKIPDHLQNYKFYLKAVKVNVMALEYIPIAYQKEELCVEAVKSDGNALKFVQKQTDKICLLSVRDFGPSLKYVKNKSETICQEAFKGLLADTVLQYVPQHLKTYELCLNAVKISGNNLEYVPENLKDYKLCKQSVECYSRAYNHIPDQFKTEELNLIAIKNNYRIMKLINNKTPEFCLKALKINKDTLKFIDIAPNNNLKETTKYLKNLIAKKQYLINNL